MQIYVSGSLAYDRIMNFGGRFSDHILPDKIHVLNVSFNVNGLKEHLGGTAGNIAYGLAQLGQRPSVLGCLGRDGQRYLDWLDAHGVETCFIRTVDEEYTAGAFITTDMADNQITGFNPGAMNHSCRFDAQRLDPAEAVVIISPGNLEDMTTLPEQCRRRGARFIFDPGQSLNILEGEPLAKAIEGAMMFISNDYELEMTLRKTGLSLDELRARVGCIVSTKAEHGSVVLNGSNQASIPAAPTDQVNDPTGAGDAYRAGLLAAMAKGRDLVEACRWGAALASFAVSCFGTQEYTVDLAEFRRRLKAIGGGEADL